MAGIVMCAEVQAWQTNYSPVVVSFLKVSADYLALTVTNGSPKLHRFDQQYCVPCCTNADLVRVFG